MMRRLMLTGAVIAVVAASACGEDEAPEPGLVSVPSEQCASELAWEGGDEGSALMHPGGDCMGCHTDRSGAPTFAVAGTVYADEFADDDCAGVEGARVSIEDDDGEVVELQTNRAGNFFLREDDASLAMPLRVEVAYQGESHAMAETIYGGNCYDCHNGADAIRAPARVLVPTPQ